MSPCQKSQQNNQRKPNVPDQRPKWHRQTKKDPVNLGAVAGAGKRLVEYFTERKACIQHEIHAWTAVRHLVGRQILQPNMAPCGHDSPGATGQNRHAPNPASHDAGPWMAAPSANTPITMKPKRCNMH